MKKCSYCGKVYADTATVCAVDGKPLWQVDPPPLPGAQPPPLRDARPIVDNEHLKLLAIFHYIFAGFAAIGLMVMLMEFVFMGVMFHGVMSASSFRGPAGPPPPFVIVFAYVVLSIVSLMLAVVAVGNILSANFLRKRRHRAFSFVVACVNCLQVPFGTALGVFTLVVLSRESVRAQYAAAQATPTLG